MVDAYRYTLTQIDLFGPTNFSVFLKKAIEVARNEVTQESQSYNILLVITVRVSLIRLNYVAKLCFFLGRHHI